MGDGFLGGYLRQGLGTFGLNPLFYLAGHLTGLLLVVALLPACDRFESKMVANPAIDGSGDGRGNNPVRCNAVAFAPHLQAALSSAVDSETVTLSGCTEPVLISVTGDGNPQIFKNSILVSGPVTVFTADTLRVRLTSAATESTTRQATVTLGGVSAVFDVTTTSDATAPSMTSVSGPANGVYKQGQHLDFTANFTENVTVTGTPRFILDIGGASRYANYLSGSGTTSLVFRYTVEASLDDTNGIDIGSLQLNGGTIQDAASNSADLSFSPPDMALVLVDTTAPTVQSASGPVSSSYVLGQNLSFALTFNEAVAVSGTPRLTLTIGSTTRFANYLSGTGTSTISFRYAVQGGDADADGITVAGTIDLNGGTIRDVATNEASLSFSAPNTSGVVVTGCPMNYVPIPALAPYTMSSFCVAKYEMKNIGGVATSQVAGIPWSNIPRGTLPDTVGGAWKACRDLGYSSGSGYDLISNAQWQTIARNLEGVGWNWSSGTVGNSGGMSRGRSDSSSPGGSLEASADDNDSCKGTGQTCDLVTWNDQRRVHRLSNGAYIWDIAGNVWEWVQDNSSTDFGANSYVSLTTPANHPNTGTIGGILNNANFHFGPAGDYTNLSSSPYGGLGGGWLNYSGGAILRGGSWLNDVNTGVFVPDLRDHPMATYNNVGFRCVWLP